MIVDDHAVIRHMLRALLEAESLLVSDAENGAECIEKARAEKPDLIILDLSMPLMNGLEAARELKVLMPRVPLLMFTNNPGGLVEKEARAAGISAVISKGDVEASKHLLTLTRTLLGLNGSEASRAS